MKPISISHFTATNAMGIGIEEISQSLLNKKTGLRPCDFPNTNLNTFTGTVPAINDVVMRPGFEEYECRNNKLVQLALEQDNFQNKVDGFIAKYGAKRIAVILGTSTSGVESLEHAYRHRDPETDALPRWYNVKTTYNFYSVTDFVKKYFKLKGPSYTIATACSSSNKVFAAAYRMMKSGLCDAALIGGVDTLCLNTLHGFNSLQLISEQVCRPNDENRDGISLGEGAGFALLEWQDQASETSDINLVGYGESSDAYHMSSPPPDGSGARLSMQLALDAANLKSNDIDYINLHGTGSQINDSTEDKAITSLFGEGMLCTATKGYTGHTLAGAGITESVISFLSMQKSFVPATVNTINCDPSFNIKVALDVEQKQIRRVLTNSFGFGGNNCSLIFESTK